MRPATRGVLAGPVVTGGYDADAQTYFAAMTVQPSAARKALLNDLIVGLKADGVWDTYDLLYIGASHDRQAATINARAPGSYTLAAVNSPLFEADSHIGAQNGGGYWSTGFNPVGIPEADRKLKSSSAAFGFWSLLLMNQDSSSMGAYQDSSIGGFSLAPRTAVNSAPAARVQNVAGFAGPPGSTPDSLGLYNARRFFSTVSIIRNQTQVTSFEVGAGAVPNQTFRIGNIQGATGVSTRAAIAFVGGFKTIQQCEAEYARFQTYLSAIGAISA